MTKANLIFLKIKSFKWADGWFTTISSKLAKLIGIPKSFKGYDPDDTFMMYCCNYMKRFDINVNQYIMNNVIVCEDYSSSLNSQKYIKNNNFRAICNAHINYEYNFFKKKIDIIYMEIIKMKVTNVFIIGFIFIINTACVTIPNWDLNKIDKKSQEK